MSKEKINATDDTACKKSDTGKHKYTMSYAYTLECGECGYIRSYNLIGEADNHITHRDADDNIKNRQKINKKP